MALRARSWTNTCVIISRTGMPGVESMDVANSLEVPAVARWRSLVATLEAADRSCISDAKPLLLAGAAAAAAAAAAGCAAAAGVAGSTGRCAMSGLTCVDASPPLPPPSSPPPSPPPAACAE